MWRLRGGPAASLTSVISACWMSVCLAAPRDLRCLRPLRHPAPVVAWLQGGVSAVGSRAFPFRPFRAVARVCFRQPGCLYAVRKSGCLPACRQCVPSTVWSVSRVVGFWAAAGEPDEIPAATVRVLGGPSPPTAWSSGFLAPCGCPALRLPLRESDLATAQKQGSVPVSQEVETSSRGSGRLSGHPGVRFEQAGEKLGGWLSQ